MTFPTPDDMADAPAWDNYVVSQCAEAALGLIPESAVALGVHVDRYDVTVHAQLRATSAQDLEELAEVIEDLGLMLDDDVRLKLVTEIHKTRTGSPHDGIRWFYQDRSAK